MSKDEELEELEKFINFLEASGATYCGPWLRHQLPGITNAIRADFCPSLYNMSWAQWKAHLDTVNSQNSLYAAAIISLAEKDAEKIRVAAEKVRDDLWQTLRQVEKILENA